MNKILFYLNYHQKIFIPVFLGVIALEIFGGILIFHDQDVSASTIESQYRQDKNAAQNNNFPQLPTPTNTNHKEDGDTKNIQDASTQNNNSSIDNQSSTDSNSSTSDTSSNNDSNSDTDASSDTDNDTNTYLGIAISGDNTCNSQTTAALNLLSSNASHYFQNVQDHVGLIECVASGSGMYVWENPPRFAAGAETRNSGTLWYAGSIAHDSCHSRQYSEGRDYSGRDAEAECLNFQYDALESMGADQYTLDYVKNLIDSEYWEIPIDERWW